MTPFSKELEGVVDSITGLTPSQREVAREQHPPLLQYFLSISGSIAIPIDCKTNTDSATFERRKVGVFGRF